MPQFSINDAQANLCSLIADALAGADVVIIHDGLPVVRLVPVAPLGKRRFGALRAELPSMLVLANRCQRPNCADGIRIEVGPYNAAIYPPSSGMVDPLT